jgi:hypothetical protein
MLIVKRQLSRISIDVFLYISEFISFHKSILICLGKRNRLMKTAKPFTLAMKANLIAAVTM